MAFPGWSHEDFLSLVLWGLSFLRKKLALDHLVPFRTLTLFLVPLVLLDPLVQTWMT